MSPEAPCVSGTLIQSLVEVAREVIGEGIVNKGFESAPGTSGVTVTTAMPGQWIPIDAVEAAFGSLAEAAGRDVYGRPGLHMPGFPGPVTPDGRARRAARSPGAPPVQPEKRGAFVKMRADPV